ncbi:hypothetical protein B5X24_HaOG214772 [Helicoverpa armigera]|uniref:Uncharacterized protein n=1 Tax=Helicoverpa armigera TaxID=29058 RepID=A0A2W1BC04_HELAM|nr:hypothetical protein B5X24_HaOG214772 [Helicoverpa armigera]
MAVFVICTIGAAILQIVVTINGKEDVEPEIEDLIRMGTVTVGVAPYDINRFLPQEKRVPPSAATPPDTDGMERTTPHVLSIPILRINSKETLLRLPTIIPGQGLSSTPKASSNI